ncbi:hypothetical protein [Mucilaginibacter sp. SP1R1]|uniref:hypothetical protein n=1 Tax=Mucilaginibacter sp. SP1R1 TaxID=2723091 RepID=UPI003B00EAF5
MVKEATTLSEANYQIHIIFTQYMSYLIPYDKEILLNHSQWTYDCLDWTKLSFKSRLRRFYTGLTLKLINLIIKVNQSKALACIVLNRNYYWQLKRAKLFRADLYFGHNLGALPIAVKAAQYTNAKCGFDAEDFHRNEISNDPNNVDVILKMLIEEKYIPLTDFINAASPLIAEKYANLFNRQVNTILNVFPKTNKFDNIPNIHAPLQIFWFSQTIGPNRGIEIAIKAICNSDVTITFHLLGNIADEYKIHLLANIKKKKSENLEIIFHNSLSPNKIFELASKFDIGLAAESYTPLNRNICLTNKLFTYLQSGLAIIATDTLSQHEFMSQYHNIGELYKNSVELTNILKRYNQNRELLDKTKKQNFNLGQNTINWQKESIKYLEIINTYLVE